MKMEFHYDDWFPKEPNVGYETLNHKRRPQGGRRIVGVRRRTSLAAGDPSHGAKAMTAQHDIRLFLADVDGALVTQDKVLTEPAKAAGGSWIRPASHSPSQAGDRPEA